jgi:glutathione synthase/RimK-type ligase-like ATP-grasp enzyme
MTAYLLVVSNPERWQLQLDGVTIVSARDYLTDPGYGAQRRWRVINLCRSYRYQAQGYYVSLLAEARGHRPMPSVTTMQDFRSPSIIRSLSTDLEDQIQRSLAPLKSDVFELSIYFSRNLAQRYDRLSRQLFNLFPAPLLRARFKRHDGEWSLQNISPVATNEIPENHREFVQEAAADWFRRRYRPIRVQRAARYEVAMLVDPKEPLPPSDDGALRLFEKAAAALELRLERITQDDYGELSQYDALFIRATTAVNHYTYRFARRAESLGLVVIDDPTSILRCTNKVYLHELLQRNHLPVPTTRVVHRDNLRALADTITYPQILKQPDSSFSQGVLKAASREEFLDKGRKLLEDSELVLSQEFVPTDFDWRVGVLDGQALYACRYFMASGHWQIYNHAARPGGGRVGGFSCVPLEEVPSSILEASVRGADLIGRGLYGVDVKEVSGRPMLIEINDNPSLDSEVEDGLLGPELYRRVMQVFLQRLQRRHEHR